MKNQTCCFTGHRNIPANKYATIQKRLESEIVNLIHQDVRNFCTGGALGFDTMAALAVLKLKEEFPHIRLILILPCKNQTVGWNEADKKIYGQILRQADKAVYTSENYFNGCMQKRNRDLVVNSGVCICYLTSEKGGTFYTVNYAKQQGLRVVNLA
ncbi:MAG: DUF1273 domain-containing protein [Oscillospiraceae bacterium]|nr:DUF1273 domain-containing protein [Oscillospiraceae bacterium]